MSQLVWATAGQNQQNDLCIQQRLRSAWASAQSDQSLCFPHEEALGTHTAHKIWLGDRRLPWAHRSFLCPATRKWRGIMLYPPKFWVSVRPSVCLSVRPSVRPSVSAHHHSCIGNSSYSFRPILLKLYRCFKDGLKICILSFQNLEIIFYHFFSIFNLDIFRALILQICIWSMYLVSATPPTVFDESFWNLTGVLRMVWRYAYCFFRILKLFFITFFAFLT